MAVGLGVVASAPLDDNQGSHGLWLSPLRLAGLDQSGTMREASSKESPTPPPTRDG